MTGPGRLDGADDRPERPSIAAALRAWHRAERRKPTEADAPPPSSFPMTRAAREALRLSRGKGLPVERPAELGEDG